MGEILEIEEILLKLNECDIFSDSSLSSGEEGRWYKGIYESKTFSDINKELLEKALENAIRLEEWFKNEIYTVPSVAKDLERLTEILHKKSNELYSRQKFPTGKEHDAAENERKIIFERMAEAYNSVYEISKNNLFEPVYPLKFECIGKLVTGVVRGIHPERDNDQYKKPKYKKAEQFIATAFYNSIVEGKSSCIVTINGYTKHILSEVLFFLTKNDTPGNQQLYYNLSKKPIYVYFARDWKAEKIAGTSQMLKGFKAFRIPEDTYLLIDKEVKQYLKEGKII
jgi:hypothetical protein